MPYGRSRSGHGSKLERGAQFRAVSGKLCRCLISIVAGVLPGHLLRAFITVLDSQIFVSSSWAPSAAAFAFNFLATLILRC